MADARGASVRGRGGLVGRGGFQEDALLALLGEGRMIARGVEALIPGSREQQWDALRSLVRELEEEHDLQGLAAVSEMGLIGLRQMCERLETCAKLGEMLEMLHQLKLDSFEMGDEQ